VVPRVIYPSLIASPPQSGAATISRLEFFKLDRVNGPPLAEVDNGGRPHGIYFARMPGVVFTGENSAGIIFTKYDERSNSEALHRFFLPLQGA